MDVPEYEHATLEGIPSSARCAVERAPLESTDRFEPRSDYGRERRKHDRTPPPALPNGTVYSLRAIAVAAPLLISDLVALLGSVLIASALIGLAIPGATYSAFRLASSLAVGLLLLNTALGLYPAIGVHPVVELRRSALATSLVVIAFILSSLLWEVDATYRWALLVTGLASLVLTPVLRSLSRRLLSRFSWWSQPLLVFGTGPVARRVSDYYARNPGLGLTPVLVKPEPRKNRDPTRSLVSREASRYGAVCAAIPVGGESQFRANGFLRECANTFPHLLVVPELSEFPGSYRAATDLGGLAGVRTGKSLLLPAPRALKRSLDTALAFLLGVLIVPFVVAIALVIKLTSAGPVLYGHPRIGRDRKPFVAWKFRSMYLDADRLLQECLASNEELREEWEQDQKLKDDPRLTAVGRFLRRTSLDELPQLWNVFRGEMSLVGPRPIVEDEVGKYGTEFGQYLSVAPGMTGLWQVSGRNTTTYEERIHLDAYYVENWSLTLDAYILGKTVTAVVSGEGAY